MLKTRWLLISPRDSDGTRKPWVITVTTMTIMLTNAKADAFASYLSVSLWSLRDTQWSDLGDVSIQRQWVRNAQNKDNDNSSAICQ